MYDQQESWIPADLKFFPSFSLAWVFSWQYRYGKQDNKSYFPFLQRNAYVKWWEQFDAFKVNPTKVKLWFQNIPKYLKIADPETSLFLNQKAKRIPSSASFAASSGDINQNKDDCFGIEMGED
ncbi:hypothetical protein SESBI_09601 [Sesbania bispinosa]|nr:hypothetical protein SESBI_09601 [Sesbania bispinosa]